MTRYNRWSDHDHYFGPFTYAKDSAHRSTAIMLSSGDDEYSGCSIRFSGFGRTLIIALPDIVRPWKEKFGKVEDPAVRARIGEHYYHVHRREYGFSLSNTGAIGDSVSLHLHYGPQTGDSRTEKSKCYFLPWTEWRHVRHSYFDAAGEHVYTEPQRLRWDTSGYDENCARIGEVPTKMLAFLDYDGETLSATTRIEEMEWRKGEGWFKWLSRFKQPIIHRTLNIEFSGETGERKGSWKGGTTSTAINMLPGELHEAAFRRYCVKHQMTFVGLLSRKPGP